MSKMSIAGTETQLEVFKDAVADACLFDPTTISECGEDADCNRCAENNIDWGVAADDDSGKLEIVCTAEEKRRLIPIIASVECCAIYNAMEQIDGNCEACLDDNIDWVIRE